MGLGIHARAVLPRRGLLRRFPRPAEVFERIRHHARAGVRDELCRRWLDFQRDDEQLNILLHPLAEPIECTLTVDGQLNIMAKTSTVGPGYHAAVVELIDHLRQACDLPIGWSWSEDDQTIEGDETGYALHRDFARLQESFREFLAGLADIVLTRGDDDSHFLLNWPLHVDPSPENKSFSMSPMGVHERAWWQGVLAASAGDEHVRQFFEWWSENRSAADWEKAACALLWSSVRWHPPRDEAQRSLIELALYCIDRSESSSFAAEADELRQLLKANPDEPSPPRAGGIGLLRGSATFGSPGGWKVTLPGYFYNREETDGATTVIWYGGTEVHISGLRFVPKDGEAPDTSKFFSVFEREVGEPVEINIPGARAKIVLSPPGEHPFWTLAGTVAVPPCLAKMTVVFDEASQQGWAMDVFRSLRPPPTS